MSKVVASKKPAAPATAAGKKPAKPAEPKDTSTAKKVPASSVKAAVSAPNTARSSPKVGLKPTTTPAATPRDPAAPPKKPATSRPTTAVSATKAAGVAKASPKLPTAVKPTTAKTTASPKTATKPAASPKTITSAVTKTTASPKTAAVTKPSTKTTTKPTTASKPITPKLTVQKPTTTKSPKTATTTTTTTTSKRPTTSDTTKLQKDVLSPPVRPATSSGASGSVSAQDVTPVVQEALKPAQRSPRPVTTQLATKAVTALARSPRATPQHTQSLPNINTEDGSILPTSDATRPLTAGSVRGRVAGPARRKPTVNPIKAVVSRPATAPSGVTRAASGYIGLAAVVGGDQLEFTNVQLKKVASEKPKILLIHVKGRRHVMARACEPLCSSLNKGDVFVLIDPSTRKIYEWRGALSNKMEIAKGMDLSGRVKNKEFGGRADIFVMEEGKTDNNFPEFWQLLGGKSTISEAKFAGEDEEEDKKEHGDIIHGFTEAAGKFVPKEIGKERLLKEMLQTGHVYIIDCFTELYMWVGRGVSAGERTAASAKAQEVEAATKGKRPRPKWVSITRVIEGAEPEIFKEKFADWPSTLPITMAAIPKGRVADAKPQEKFDVTKMYTTVKKEDKLVDNGLGTVKVWKVKDHAKEEVPADQYGQFFTAESYVILYTYVVRNREVYMIYFWQGKKSSINEKGSSALLTVDLDDSIGGNATQIRVVQNKEPKHFMSLFKGSIIVHKGTADDVVSPDQVAMYQIRTFNIDGAFADVRAIQLPIVDAKTLNTNDCFIVNSSSKQYIWVGANSAKFCNVTSERLAEVGAVIKGEREQVVINEGSEDSEFWSCIGGKALYAGIEWKWYPRMFHCSSASGSFVIDEVLDWDQDDLDNGHLNILDTSNEIYLWVGQRASLEEEKKNSMQSVLEYVNNHPLRTGVDDKDNVLVVRAFQEPVAFSCHFHAWDGSKSTLKNGAEAPVMLVEDVLHELSREYTLAELQNPPKMLDSTKLESYLSDGEFVEVFKLDKAAFYKQPVWKQEQQKKGVGIY